MDDPGLTRLLRRLPVRGRTRDSECADEILISAYVDGSLDPAARVGLEQHLADCADCLALVAFLTRVTATDPPGTVPPRLLNAAAPRQRPRLRLVPALAAAASIVLAAAFLLTRPPVPPPAADEATRASAVPEIPLVVAPHEGELLELPALEVRWRSVPGALYHTVQLMNGSGDLIWEGRSDGDRARLPATLELESGRSYYTWVEAHLAGGTSVRSRATRFELKPP